MKQEFDVEVTWEPFELNPTVPPDGMPTPRSIVEKWKQFGSHVQRMAQEAGLPMVMHEWTPNTRRALAATEYAKDQGRGNEFHRIVFRMFYGEGQNIGSWDVLREAAQETGLDPDATQEVVDNGPYLQRLEEKFIAARRMGITGVPLYVFDHKYGISGAQPYEVFQQFMQQYLAGELDR